MVKLSMCGRLSVLRSMRDVEALVLVASRHNREKHIAISKPTLNLATLCWQNPKVQHR
jgi:hypothetical protein